MSIISRTGDLFYAFRFLKLLTTPWEKTKAFENGIIDDNGKVLMRSREIKDPEARSSYTVFHRLVFNIKRLLGKLPFGKTKLASYAAALFLIKEHTGMEDTEIVSLIEKATGEKMDMTLNESTWFEKDGQLCPGTYTLKGDAISRTTGEYIAMAKSKIVIEQFLSPESSFCGVNVYKIKHLNQEVYITNQDITK